MEHIPEFSLTQFVQNHQYQLPVLYNHWNSAAMGHKKYYVQRKIEANEVPATELNQWKSHISQELSSSDAKNPISIPQLTRDGQYQPFILFYVQASDNYDNHNNEKNDDHHHLESGLYCVTAEIFEEIKNKNNAKVYQDLIKSLAEDIEDIDRRPIRLGCLEWAEHTAFQNTVSKEEKSNKHILMPNTERAFFARYNIAEHGVNNTVTLNLMYVSPVLCAQDWSFQPFGYDAEVWNPIWSRMKAEADHPHMNIAEATFPKVLIPDLKAFHTLPHSYTVDAVYNSWSNLTLLPALELSSAS